MEKSECDFIFARPSGKRYLIILCFRQDDYIDLLLELHNAIHLMSEHEQLNDIDKSDGTYTLQITGLKNIGLSNDIILKNAPENKTYEEMYSSLTQQAMSDIVNKIQQIKGDISGPEKNRRNAQDTSNRKRADGIPSSSESTQGGSLGTGEESE